MLLELRLVDGNDAVNAVDNGNDEAAAPTFLASGVGATSSACNGARSSSTSIESQRFAAASAVC